VVTSNLRDRPKVALGRDSELVSVALHDQRRDGHRVELGETARRRLSSGAARRLEREREAKDADRADRLGGSAGHARPERPASHDERQPRQLLPAQALDNGGPRRVELARRRRRPPPGHAVGLLDEDDAEAFSATDLCGRDEVRGGHAPARSMPEHERAAWLVDGLEMGSRRPVRRVDLEGRNARLEREGAGQRRIRD
jgi:hypothetical protein